MIDPLKRAEKSSLFELLWSLVSCDDFARLTQLINELDLEKTFEGETPLGYVTRLIPNDTSDHYGKFLVYLVKRGANPNVHDEVGRTPLTNLARSNRVDCIRLLVEFGADINFNAPTGYSPLEEALRVNTSSEAAEYFLTHPNTKLTPEYKVSLLNCARRAGSRKSLALLKRHKIVY